MAGTQIGQSVAVNLSLPGGRGTISALRASNRSMRSSRFFPALAAASILLAGCAETTSTAMGANGVNSTSTTLGRSASPSTLSILSTASGLSVSTTTSGPRVTTVDGLRAEYFGPIPHGETDTNTGVALSVPPADQQPMIPWERAVANCFATGGICNRYAGAIRVSLAVGFYPNSGQMEPNGSIDPAMNHVLVFAVAQTVDGCAPVGPGPSPRTTPTSAIRYEVCTALTFIDARSGGGLAAMSGPSIRDPSLG